MVKVLLVKLMSTRIWQLLTQPQDHIAWVSQPKTHLSCICRPGSRAPKTKFAGKNRLDDSQSASPFLGVMPLGKPSSSQRGLGKGDLSGWGWLDSWVESPPPPKGQT